MRAGSLLSPPLKPSARLRDALKPRRAPLPSVHSRHHVRGRGENRAGRPGYHRGAAQRNGTGRIIVVQEHHGLLAEGLAQIDTTALRPRQVDIDFGPPLHSLVIVGETHPIEDEALKMYGKQQA